MNAETASVAADLWTKPICLSYKPACRQPVNCIHHRHVLLLLNLKVDTHFIIPRRIEGWVDLGGWPHTQTVYLSAVTHPSSNRARCRLTKLNKVNALTTTLRHPIWSTLTGNVAQTTSRRKSLPFVKLHIPDRQRLYTVDLAANRCELGLLWLLALRDYLRVGGQAVPTSAFENQLGGNSKVVFIERLSIVTHASSLSWTSSCSSSRRLGVYMWQQVRMLHLHRSLEREKILTFNCASS